MKTPLHHGGTEGTEKSTRAVYFGLQPEQTALFPVQYLFALQPERVEGFDLAASPRQIKKANLSFSVNSTDSVVRIFWKEAV
jgi:hypothetical protein